MSFFEVFFIALGLSMDAFAVAVCKGAAIKRCNIYSEALIGGYFGVFQAAMPLLGAFVGAAFVSRVERFSPYIAFVLLAIIGMKMIKGSTDDTSSAASGRPLAFSSMLPLAIATSIDALAVGVTFALHPETNLYASACLIGIVTFAMSALGAKVGESFGTRYKSKAEIIGGAILIGIGLKFLIEGLMKI